MKIDHETLARRIRQAREESKMTQEEVSTALGLTRTAVVQIELGNRAVSSLELLAMAKLFSKGVTDFFKFDSQAGNESPLVVLHRLAPGLIGEPGITQHVEHCLMICREGTSLEGLLGRNDRLGPPAYRLSEPRNSGEAVLQGSQIADEERKRLGLGVAPISDLCGLLNAQDIWASGVVLPDRMSGLFLNHTATGLVILVNATHGDARRRFSYSHEYAHALLDREHGGAVTSKENSTELVEKRANAFAASFLMPREGVLNYLENLHKGQPSRSDMTVFDVATTGRIDAQFRTAPRSQTVGYQDVAEISNWFKVSYTAAVYRLRSLDLISQSRCTELLDHEPHARSYREVLDLFDEEHAGKQERELISHVTHLAIEAFRRGVISCGRLLELSSILQINGKRLLELAEAAK